MAVLSILTYPHPLLRQKCQKVRIFDDNLKNFAADMLETMREKYGVGLAAPQVGKTIRLIVIEFDPKRFEKTEDHPPTSLGVKKLKTADIKPRAEQKPIPLTILVNPKVISSAKEKETSEEGCLSLPGIELLIERAEEVKVLAQNLEGNRIKIKTKGYFSRILQHEIDHLNGILITDKGKKIKKLTIRGQPSEID